MIVVQGLRRVGPKSLFTGGTDLAFINTPESGRIKEHNTEGRWLTHVIISPSLSSRQFLYRDWSGSITSAPSSYIVSSLPHMVDSRWSPSFPSSTKVLHSR